MATEHDLLMEELLKIRDVWAERLDILRMDIEDVARELQWRQCNSNGEPAILQERLLRARLKVNPNLDGVTPWYEHDEMPAPHVDDQIDNNFAPGVEEGVLGGEGSDLVHQVVQNALAEDASRALPQRSDSGFSELLQNNHGQNPLSPTFATTASLPATLTMTMVTTSSTHVPVVTTSVAGRPVQPGVYDIQVSTAPGGIRIQHAQPPTVEFFAQQNMQAFRYGQLGPQHLRRHQETKPRLAG